MALHGGYEEATIVSNFALKHVGPHFIQQLADLQLPALGRNVKDRSVVLILMVNIRPALD